jgi:uncharacterized protein (TIGR02284 family)
LKEIKMHTPHIKLDDEAVDQLQDLVKLNHDAAKGLREAAEQLESPALTRTLGAIADERDQLRFALARQVCREGEEVPEGGKLSAAFHRQWMKLRAAVSSNEEKAVLEEAERGEDIIKSAYEEALQDDQLAPVRSMLSEQFARVKAGHDRIRLLRDAC